MKQLVFKKTLVEPLPVASRGDAGFVLATNPFALCGHMGALSRCVGALGMLKTLVKLVSRKRSFFLVVSEGKVLHHGWVSVGFCRYYPVGERDCVIGPLWSDKAIRGQGIGTWALGSAMNGLLGEGFSSFWIDTSEDNIPCLRVIDHCEYGPPAMDYERQHADLPGGAEASEEGDDRE